MSRYTEPASIPRGNQAIIQKFLGHLDIQDKTRALYEWRLTKLQSQANLSVDDILMMPQRYIIQKVNGMKGFKPNTKRDFLQTCVHMRAYYGKAVRSLQRRTKAVEKTAQKRGQKRTRELVEDENVGEKWEKAYRHLLANGDAASVVVSYLLWNYGVRLADLRMIRSNKAETLAGAGGKNRIHASTRGLSVTYTRASYKTVSTHGPKTHVIRNQRFRDAVLELAPEVGNHVLHASGSPGQSVTTARIGAMISEMWSEALVATGTDWPTDKRVTQAMIYKVRQHALQESGNARRRNKLAKDRGHTESTRDTYYTGGQGAAESKSTSG